MKSLSLKNIALYIVAALLCVGIAAYIVVHLTSTMSTEVETVVSEIVAQENTVTADAYIFRPEKLVNTSQSGIVNYLVSDDSKTAAGSVLAQVYVGASGTAGEKLAAIDEKIRILENSNMSAGSISSDTKSIDEQIYKSYFAMRSALDAGNISLALEKKDDLLISLNKRRIITKSITNYNAEIDRLKAEKQNLTASVGGTATAVSSTAAGYFYSAVDGYENIFDVSKLATITLGDFEGMINSSPESVSPTTVGKLVTDYKWYIACKIDRGTSHKYTVGSSVKVYFPNNDDKSVLAAVYSVVTDDTRDYALLILETGERPSDFDYLRTQTVDIVLDTYKGFKVPVSALRVIDGKRGVFVLNVNTIRFKQVDILVESDGYVIAECKDSDDENARLYLSLNDLIITKGNNLYDGKSIG